MIFRPIKWYKISLAMSLFIPLLAPMTASASPNPGPAPVMKLPVIPQPVRSSAHRLSQDAVLSDASLQSRTYNIDIKIPDDELISLIRKHRMDCESYDSQCSIIQSSSDFEVNGKKPVAANYPTRQPVLKLAADPKIASEIVDGLTGSLTTESGGRLSTEYQTENLNETIRELEAEVEVYENLLGDGRTESSDLYQQAAIAKLGAQLSRSKQALERYMDLSRRTIISINYNRSQYRGGFNSGWTWNKMMPPFIIGSIILLLLMVGYIVFAHRSKMKQHEENI